MARNDSMTGPAAKPPPPSRRDSPSPSHSPAATVSAEEITTHLAIPQPGAVFSDRKIASAVVPEVDVGDVVEYRYTLHIRRAYALPDHLFHADLPEYSLGLILQPWRLASPGQNMQQRLPDSRIIAVSIATQA